MTETSQRPRSDTSDMTALKINANKLREIVADAREALAQQLPPGCADIVDGELTRLTLSIIAAAQPPRSRLGERVE
jgi:hypothetical protein